MSRWDWGYLYWGLVLFGIAFLPAELSAIKGIAPWPTLSGTIQHLVQGHALAGIVVLGAILCLAVHFLFDQRFWPSALFGLSVAVSAHFLNNRWP